MSLVHTLKLEANTFRARDEHFSASNEHIENARSEFSHVHTHTHTCVRTHTHTYTHTASYQQLANSTYLYVEMIGNHRYSPPETGVFHCTTLVFMAKSIEKPIAELLLTHSWLLENSS